MYPSQDSEVALEARAEIVRRGRVGVWFTILYAVFALIVMAERNSVNGLWKTWGILLFGGSIVRMLIINRWKHFSPSATGDAFRSFCLVSMTVCLAVGLTPLMIFQNSTIASEDSILGLFGVIAMSSGALVVYAPSRRLSIACMILYLAPGIAGSFFQASRTGIYFGLVLVMQLFFVIVQGKRLHESYWQSAENAWKAERASRAKSDFLASVSHEMRTPMHGILGMTKLALETNLNSTQREYVEASQKSASSLLGLINGLLDLSKIEAGRMDIESAPFPVREVAGEALVGCKFSAQEKGLQLRLHLAPNVPTHLVGDAARLRQVLVNLAGNAVKFTHKGEVEVAITGESKGRRRFRLDVRVTDTGIGIVPERQTHIFEAFVQADQTVARRYGGTGLGLAISRNLVTLMGGDLKLASEPGKGSSFFFSLDMEVAEPSADCRKQRTSTGIPARTLRILVVDDNPVNRILATRLLDRWGHHVDAATDGLQALAACDESAYDLIFMDMQMPEMDGLTAARALRARGMQSPIIALTANARLDDRDECLRAGMNGYLSKPFTSEELFVCTEQAMADHHSGLQARSVAL